jgi:hypothetical protein
VRSWKSCCKYAQNFPSCQLPEKRLHYRPNIFIRINYVCIKQRISSLPSAQDTTDTDIYVRKWNFVYKCGPHVIRYFRLWVHLSFQIITSLAWKTSPLCNWKVGTAHQRCAKFCRGLVIPQHHFLSVQDPFICLKCFSVWIVVLETDCLLPLLIPNTKVKEGRF